MGVLSFAKMYGLSMFIIALIIAIPYGLFFIAWGVLGGSSIGGQGGLAVGGGGVVAGIAIMIILPIVYGILGFIFGAIGAFIYNVLAGMIGGVEIEVENV